MGLGGLGWGENRWFNSFNFNDNIKFNDNGDGNINGNGKFNDNINGDGDGFCVAAPPIISFGYLDDYFGSYLRHEWIDIAPELPRENPDGVGRAGLGRKPVV